MNRHAGVAGIKYDTIAGFDIGGHDIHRDFEFIQCGGVYFGVDVVPQPLSLEKPVIRYRQFGHIAFLQSHGDLLQGIGIISIGVEAADKTSHTRADNHMERDLAAFKDFQHTDMGKAFGGTRAKDKRNFSLRSRCDLGFRCCCGTPTKKQVATDCHT